MLFPNNGGPTQGLKKIEEKSLLYFAFSCYWHSPGKEKGQLLEPSFSPIINTGTKQKEHKIK